jgi:EpsI family protein
MDKQKTVALIAVVLTVVVGGAAYALRARQSGGRPANVHFEALPLQFANYRGEETRFDEATYTLLKADTTTLRRYAHDGGALWLFVAYFGEQNFGQQIHSPKHCLPGGGWQIQSIEQVQLNVPGLGQVPTNRLLIEANGVRQVMYYFFITQIGFVVNELDLKLELVRAALSFKARDAAFVRLTVPVNDGDLAVADHAARQFLVDATPLLLRGLPFR